MDAAKPLLYADKLLSLFILNALCYYKIYLEVFMAEYTMLDRLAFFYIYCFLGWCFESGYASIKQRRLINRGFLRGPFIPIYSFGALFVLIITDNFQGNSIAVYFSGMAAATLLEYITGYIMERLFKVKYWDYSERPLNLHGYISLSASIAWGFLSVILTNFLQVNISKFVLSLTESTLIISISGISVIFVLDVLLSFKAAFSLAKAFAALEKARSELSEIKERLSIIKGGLISETQSKLSSIKSEVTDRINLANGYISGGKSSFSTLKSEIENVFQSLSQTVVAKSPDYLALKRKYEVARERYSLSFPKFGKVIAFFIRNMIKGNPGLNKRYLDQIKELSESRKNNKE